MLDISLCKLIGGMAVTKSLIPKKPYDLWETGPLLILSKIHLSFRVGYNKAFLSIVEEIDLNKRPTDDRILQISFFGLDQHIIHLASWCDDGYISERTSRGL